MFSVFFGFDSIAVGKVLFQLCEIVAVLIKEIKVFYCGLVQQFLYGLIPITVGIKPVVSYNQG
jgi:hypothetical protein